MAEFKDITQILTWFISLFFRFLKLFGIETSMYDKLSAYVES